MRWAVRGVSGKGFPETRGAGFARGSRASFPPDMLATGASPLVTRYSFLSTLLRLVSLAVCLFLIAGGAFAQDKGAVTPQPDSGGLPLSTGVRGPPEPAAPETPLAAGVPLSVSALSAVIIDAATGQVICERNAYARRPNASTTKIMTAILLIEHCKTTDKIKVSKRAAETPFTSLHLKCGEEISVGDLLTGMMVRSANDAAVAAAEHVAGSVPKFVAMMNAKAREIGCRHTHFVTPNGLPAPGHYSSAYRSRADGPLRHALPHFQRGRQHQKVLSYLAHHRQERYGRGIGLEIPQELSRSGWGKVRLYQAGGKLLRGQRHARWLAADIGGLKVQERQPGYRRP